MTALTTGGRHGRARCVVLAGVQGREVVDGHIARVDTVPDPEKPARTSALRKENR